MKMADKGNPSPLEDSSDQIETNNDNHLELSEEKKTETETTEAEAETETEPIIVGHLASLKDTETFIIKQNVEIMEVAAQALATSINADALGGLAETVNTYDVYTDTGDLKYQVIETSEWKGSCCCMTGRCCCRPNHKLQLHVYDLDYSFTKEVMYVERPCVLGCGCCAWCPPCCQRMTVYESKEDDLKHREVAYIRNPFLGGCFTPQLQVMDRGSSGGDGKSYASITAEAGCTMGGLFGNKTFIIRDAEGNDIGMIYKQGPESFADLVQNLMTDADNYVVEFPKEFKPDQKAGLLFATHLIDYWFFEREGHMALNMEPLAKGLCPEIRLKLFDLYCCGCLCPCSCSLGGQPIVPEEVEGENDALLVTEAEQKKT